MKVSPKFVSVVVIVVACIALFRMNTRKSTSTVTVKNELLTGLEPIGKCLYVYGGGWNEEDTGAGEEAAKYHNYLRDNMDYLANYDEIVWDDAVLADPDNYRNMPAEEIFKDLLGDL